MHYSGSRNRGFSQTARTDGFQKFAAALLEQTGIFLLPGACFGYEEYFRIGFGQKHDHLEEVLRKLEQFAADWMNGC